MIVAISHIKLLFFNLLKYYYLTSLYRYLIEEQYLSERCLGIKCKYRVLVAPH